MRIILCVTNDIATDQRVRRIASSLRKIFSGILIVGTVSPKSLSLQGFPFSVHRIPMLFKKGPLFYAEYNCRLFFYLLFCRTDILVANDLDTLPAVFMAARIKRLPLVYDSHEYFTELPELVQRPGVKRIWAGIEKLILPRIRYAYTVSQSIATEYKRKYGIGFRVVRNLPVRLVTSGKGTTVNKNTEKLIIYQGSLNMGRGLEIAIRAMEYMENTKFVIAGAGYLENELKELVKALKLNDRISFTGRIPPEDLIHYTVRADLGISLEENSGLNYYYALPNKLFDYIQARIPVLVSDLPEMAAVVKEFEVGRVVSVTDPHELARVFREMLTDELQRKNWLSNLEKASMELCWENEEKILMEIYARVITDNQLDKKV